MVHRSSRMHSSQRIAGVFTMLVVVMMALTSFGIAVNPFSPSALRAPVTRAVEPSAITLPTFELEGPIPSTATAGETDGHPIGIEDGVIPDEAPLSPFDSEHAAIMNLDTELRTAIRNAATDAEADGVENAITSGWKSRRYQRALLDEAGLTYGSRAEARKWVNTPGKSAHVTGHAVVVGYTDADYWLIQHGNAYGLCQTYANEIWHLELLVEPGETCPSPKNDASAG